LLLKYDITGQLEKKIKAKGEKGESENGTNVLFLANKIYSESQ